MKNIPPVKTFALLLLLSLFLLHIQISRAETASLMADKEKKEKEYLHQIFNQLDALQPLILSAEKLTPSHIRIQFHYTRYKDQSGQFHNGLLEDVQQIKAGIAEKLNHPAIEPRFVLPIRGDYLENKR